MPQRVPLSPVFASLRRRARPLTFGCAALTAVTTMAAGFLPLPFVDGYLAGKVIDRISAEFTCPGGTGTPPAVMLRDGRLLPQLLRRRLSEIDVSVPDMALGNVQHAALVARLRGVRQSGAGAQIAGMDMSITVPFSGLPAPEGARNPVLSRTDDGHLRVKVIPDPALAKDLRTTVFLKLGLKGNALTITPERLSLFGGTVPGSKFSRLGGGTRTHPLPPLPAGMAYTSVMPQEDGLHIRLDGTNVTPLSTLPASVDGQKISYREENGLLGISTEVQVPELPLPSIPLTILVEPHIEQNSLVMRPRLVRLLGYDHPPDDPLALLVLSQIKQAALTHELPALTKGIAYRSVSVVPDGIKVVVGGETVTPFSELSMPDTGRQTVFGAQDGMLTITSTGAFVNGPPLAVTLLAQPKIVDNSLDLTPQSIEMLDTLFPVANVLREFKIEGTVHPLPVLPDGLSYSGVSVLPRGLDLNLHGENVDMTRNSLEEMKCPAPEESPLDALGSAAGRTQPDDR